MKKFWWISVITLGLVGVGAFTIYYVTHNLSAVERWVMSVPPSSQTPDERKTLSSLQVVNDHPFY